MKVGVPTVSKWVEIKFGDEIQCKVKVECIESLDDVELEKIARRQLALAVQFPGEPATVRVQ